MEAGHLEAAEKDFEAVLARPKTIEHVNARYNLGLLRSRQLRWADAERDLTTVLADDPGYTKAARERGLARMKLEDFRGALEDFLLVLREEPKSPTANYNAALCLLTTDRATSPSATWSGPFRQPRKAMKRRRRVASSEGAGAPGKGTMSLQDILRPVLDAPDARAVAFLDPQGQEIASLGERDLLETLAAYHSVWSAELARAAAGAASAR